MKTARPTTIGATTTCAANVFALALLALAACGCDPVYRCSVTVATSTGPSTVGVGDEGPLRILDGVASKWQLVPGPVPEIPERSDGSLMLRSYSRREPAHRPLTIHIGAYAKPSGGKLEFVMSEWFISGPSATAKEIWRELVARLARLDM
jgi:hypothetical protein